MDITTFSERLRETRLKKKLNYKELAEISGVTATAISYYEKGTKMPQLDNAVKLAEALGVSLDWLCSIENNSDESSGNMSTLTSLKLLIDTNEYSFKKESSDLSEGEFSLSFHFSCLLQDDIVGFVEEFIAIKELKENSSVLTDEMYNTLLNALFEKYKR